MKKYELTDHTADMAITVFGATAEALFENAAFCLFDIIGGDPSAQPVTDRQFSLERDSMEELLVEWLNSLLFSFETEGLLFCRFRVITLSPGCLVAEAGGYPVPEGFSPKTVIKSVTYHNLYVSESGGVWQAGLVADI